MPAAKTDGFLDDAMKSDENRFGPIISGNDNLSMARKNRKLLLAAITTALKLRERAIDGTLHSFNHFQISETEMEILKKGKNREEIHI